MKLREGTPLEVTLEFGPERRLQVGRLAFDRNVAVLEYARPFRDSGLRINPRFGAPGPDLVRAESPREFGGLHGVFADSLPDAWGLELMRRRVERHGTSFASLTTLDKLAIVGRRGPGALVYAPVIPPEENAAIDLDRLAQESMALLAGKDSEVLPQLEQLGGSSGGTRPKVLVAMNTAGDLVAGADRIPDGYSAWIVKFRTSHDVQDIGPLEAAYADMARAAGLVMSETKLVRTGKKKRGGAGYFATKRFDRLPDGRRVHMLSMGALLEAGWQVPSASYETLFAVTRAVTRDQRAVDLAFRRMAFNVAAGNGDDHVKQHAFLMDEVGNWSLAPAYDLTFSSGPGGEHYLTVAGRGRRISRADALAVAKEQSVAPAAAREMLNQAIEAVGRFGEFADVYGVSPATRREVEAGIAANVKDLT